MLAVVIDVVCALLAVLYSANTAADACLAVVVLAQVLRVGEHGLEELQGHYFHAGGAGAVGQWSLVFNLVDAAHADVLNDVEVLKILLAEGHPEAGLTDGGIVFNERLQFLVVQQVALPRSDVRIGERLVDFQRLGFYPLPVFVVEAFLRYLADVDFRVEVGGKGLVMVAGIAVHDVKVVYLVEVVLGGVGRIDAAHARVEAAAQDGSEPGLAEAVHVCPLP